MRRVARPSLRALVLGGTAWCTQMSLCKWLEATLEIALLLGSISLSSDRVSGRAPSRRRSLPHVSKGSHGGGFSRGVVSLLTGSLNNIGLQRDQAVRGSPVLPLPGSGMLGKSRPV